MSQPTISCIVPVYNSERFVAEAIESIEAQTYTKLEVIVVDDGSTDGTARILSGLGNRIVRLERPNGGPAAARNTGVAAATGEFIAFLDADDLWHPEKLERQMARFVARAELELCLTYKRVFWVPEMRAEEQRLRQENHPFVQDHPGYVCQTMLMPRTTYEKVGRFDETLRIGEDTEWLARAGALGIVREVLSDVLVFRRMHQNNLSYSRFSEQGAQDRMKLAMSRLQQRRKLGT